MPVIAGHLMRLTIGGSLFADEQWSNTWYFDAQTTAQPNGNAMAQALTIYQTLISSAATIDYWKYNEINVQTGHYLEQVSHTTEVVPPLSGSVPYTAPQLTLVLSLLTDFKRGPAHAGRIFFPMAPGVNADGRITSGDRDAYQAQAVLLIKAFVATKSHLPIVWSPTNKVMQPIRTVAFGRVIDTQRRRRKSLKEGYIGQSIT